MNQVKHSIDSPLKKSAPLFGSSWVALFLLLRDSLGNNSQALVMADTPNSRNQTTRH
ncbi:MAG: hypothetical protein HKO64_06410 [Xanthomonadales bacterium]|nr:hypothetical protein [Gammaproteobacteria bacterium]NNE05127.1 hypothetical protein [Xanthomonadales bacterium]NNL95238.1 hypothetical protein [Xanthomonadales bacterium]